jgi:hypothetical protein
MPSPILIGVDGCIAHRLSVFVMNDFVELFDHGTTTVPLSDGVGQA